MLGKNSIVTCGLNIIQIRIVFVLETCLIIGALEQKSARRKIIKSLVPSLFYKFLKLITLLRQNQTRLQLVPTGVFHL